MAPLIQRKYDPEFVTNCFLFLSRILKKEEKNTHFNQWWCTPSDSLPLLSKIIPIFCHLVTHFCPCYRAGAALGHGDYCYWFSLFDLLLNILLIFIKKNLNIWDLLRHKIWELHSSWLFHNFFIMFLFPLGQKLGVTKEKKEMFGERLIFLFFQETPPLKRNHLK